jgi:AraC family transcriptional regulator
LLLRGKLPRGELQLATLCPAAYVRELVSRMARNEIHRRPDGLPRGAELLAASFGKRPLASSEGRGWKGLAACSWRVGLDEYVVPEAPETSLALHTRGAVSAHAGRGWETDRSLPGQVTVIPPRSGAAIRPLKFTPQSRRSALEVTTFYIPDSTLENLIGEHDLIRFLTSIRMRWGFQDAFLSAALARLAEELFSPRERGSLYADSLADAIALHLLRDAATTRKAEAAKCHGLDAVALRVVRERIEASLCDGVSLEDLASEVGLSRYHFARAFKTSTGLSPHRYLTERRVDKAKELLRTTEMPMVDLALAVGFASQAHLCDWFRRLVGMSPREFRRSC